MQEENEGALGNDQIAEVLSEATPPGTEPGEHVATHDSSRGCSGAQGEGGGGQETRLLPMMKMCNLPQWEEFA